MKRYLFLVSFLMLLVFSSGIAQTVDLNADVVNRYVWRGTDFGNALSIQPGLSIAFSELEVGTWASYALDNPDANEHDFYISYALGNFSLTATDYYFPATPTSKDEYDFFNFDNSGNGAHYLELSAGYSGEEIPLSIIAGIFVYNDYDAVKMKDRNSIYLECGYTLGPVDIFIGVGDGMYTLDGDFAPVNVGLSSSKDIKITDDFSLPVFGQLIINPDRKRSHLVFGFSL